MNNKSHHHQPHRNQQSLLSVRPSPSSSSTAAEEEATAVRCRGYVEKEAAEKRKKNNHKLVSPEFNFDARLCTNEQRRRQQTPYD